MRPSKGLSRRERRAEMHGCGWGGRGGRRLRPTIANRTSVLLSGSPVTTAHTSHRSPPKRTNTKWNHPELSAVCSQGP